MWEGNTIDGCVLLVDAQLCTGCRLCEVACSLRNEDECAPALSRIRIIQSDEGHMYFPIVCLQCSDAPCLASCPVGALAREDKTNAITIDYEKCIGCRRCLQACPMGAIFLGNTGKYKGKPRVLKCDLCHGNPNCVLYCDTGAIRYVHMSCKT